MATRLAQFCVIFAKVEKLEEFEKLKKLEKLEEFEKLKKLEKLEEFENSNWLVINKLPDWRTIVFLINFAWVRTYLIRFEKMVLFN